MCDRCELCERCDRCWKTSGSPAEGVSTAGGGSVEPDSAVACSVADEAALCHGCVGAKPRLAEASRAAIAAELLPSVRLGRFWLSSVGIRTPTREEKVHQRQGCIELCI